MFRSQTYLQRVQVGEQMLDFAAADDGEDIGRFVHNVRNGDCGDVFGADLLAYLFEDVGDGPLFLVALPFGLSRSSLDVGLPPRLTAASQNQARQKVRAPPLLKMHIRRSNKQAQELCIHPFTPRHRNKLPLKCPIKHIPMPLINRKRRLPMIIRILIRLRNHPRRRVRNTQMQNLPRNNQVMQAIHDLLDRGGPVPPMDVEDVNI